MWIIMRENGRHRRVMMSESATVARKLNGCSTAAQMLTGFRVLALLVFPALWSMKNRVSARLRFLFSHGGLQLFRLVISDTTGKA